MSAGQRVDGHGEHLLLDQPVPVVHLGGLPDEGDRHLGADDLVTPDDHEVDMGDRLGHRMALHLAGQRQVGALGCLEREELVGPGLTVEGDPELAGHDRHRERIGAVPVDDAGDLALTAQAAHGAAADGAPDFGGKDDFGHGDLLRWDRTGGSGAAVVPPRTAIERSRNRGPGTTAVPGPAATGSLRPGCPLRRAPRPRCPRTPRQWRQR